uniref:Fanconi anemia group M protein n=1 Tax=Euleptes europaea TaxID=460621 RepID=UPI00253FCDFC|nr:Fanconi anemia group M protein [Euleptes europaea]
MRPSGASRQATLFQAWGGRPAPSGSRRGDGDGDDDEALLRAALEAEAAAASGGEGVGVGGGPLAGGFVGGPAGGLWLFPWGRGVEERGYQVQAARAALESNTLLCLPTGLGKTLVAAVVLRNFHRWFPAGRAVFLAPTKPLVAQQRDACARLAGIPQAHMARMTGGTQVADRKEIWQSKRVFFLTPQIMINDLSRGLCPAAGVKCLVIDEAHKALGNHAYCQVVKELCKYTQQFRILALSATPGSDTKAVQQVISNLLISHIELWSEDSPDIQPYSYERLVEKCVVPLGEELSEMRAAYIRVLESFAGRLIRFRVLAQRDISALTKYQIILARDQFRKNPATCVTGVQQGIIEGDFALCISLYHGYELLLQMGMQSLYIFLSGIMDGTKGMTRARNELRRNEEFMALYGLLEGMFANPSETSANGSMRSGKEKLKPFIYSHPKLKKLEEVVVEHFKSWKEHGAESKPADTRVMIFSSFRDSVHEIAEMLSRHHPVVRVMTFVGHSTGKNAKGFTQKEQLEVVKHFRAGGYNTLVSTCVGEEGLDIGEVDLIVCFDAQKSPIRLVQRMGRTGRKRQGRIVVILSEGREERTYNQSQSNKRSLLRAISENKVLRLYQHSPRMIPEGVNPKMHRVLVTPPEPEQDASPPSPTEGRAVALQRKWLPGYAGPGAKQTDSSEGWCLTAEEFEVWNRSYRVKAEDGIKQPVMPQSSFETLKDGEEKRDSRAEGVYELSLTEWRLWQNRPFPTHLVDHSERCGHFISVMEMIERMRHEEGDCSYELKIQPYLHREDVDASALKRSRSVLDPVAAPKASSSRNSPGTVSVADRRSSSPQDLDAECLSLFKAASFNPTKRAQALGIEAEGCSEESSSFSSRPLLSDEDTGPRALPDGNRDCSRTRAGREAAVARGFPGAVKRCRSQDGHSVDADSGCFSEDNLLVSDSLFYLPVPVKDSLMLPVPSAVVDPSCGRDVLISATGLLSQTPPSLNELLDFLRTNDAQQPDSEQKCVSHMNVSQKVLEILLVHYLYIRTKLWKQLIAQGKQICLLKRCTGDREHKNQNSGILIAIEGASSGSEDEVVFLGKSKRKRNVLISPNLDWSSDESADFVKKANRICVAESEKPGRGVKRQKRLDSNMTKKAAKQFIDEEAALSDDGAAEVSSDETVDSEDELMSSSLNQFLNDETQILQGLDESEMQAVYLESVRSPAISNRQGRTIRKLCDPAAVFSQVPELDESYVVDSFCVQEGEEEEERQPRGSSSEGEEICLNFDLLGEESFADGRKQYCTRRRRKQKEARAAEKPRGLPGLQKKPSRILILDDSSEDEGDIRSEPPVEPLPSSKAGAGRYLAPSRVLDSSLHRGTSTPKDLVPLPQENRTRLLLDLKASLAEELDFQPQGKGPSKTELLGGDLQSSLKLPPGSRGNPAPLCILADSREISSGPNVISTLKAVHGFKVEVCSLGSCDYIVSNRLAVERRCQAELVNGVQRSKVAQRVQQLKGSFDRICVIVEKERAKAGEAQRGFQRTKHYDGLLSSFLRAGIRVLFSSCQEETAELLKELALVEQRKGAAILVPTEVQGPGQDALRFYLSVPGVSYVTALALCHRFRSVEEVTNSSPSELVARTQVTQQKAEEIYHYLHYAFDKQMLPERVT